MSARAMRLLIAIVNTLGFGWIALAESHHVTKPPGSTMVSAMHVGTDDQSFHPDKDYASEDGQTDGVDAKKEPPPPSRKPQSNPENPTE